MGKWIMVLVVALSLGCATDISKKGLRVVWGDATIGTNCDSEGGCRDMVQGRGFTEGFIKASTAVIMGVFDIVKKLPIVGSFFPKEHHEHPAGVETVAIEVTPYRNPENSHLNVVPAVGTILCFTDDEECISGW